jgi:S-adenosylmethionine/arginine decarboxylase-like enzyme
VDTRAQHFYSDVWLKTEVDDQLISKVCEVIERRLTVVDRVSHKFEPQGETILFVLAESHFSLHVYPEFKYITMDVYVCNMGVDLKSIFDEILNHLEIDHVESNLYQRGNPPAGRKSPVIPNIERNSFMIAVTFTVAMCSILYELMLAQTLSSTMGNSVFRYNITIGLYIASMGVGALYFSKLIKKNWKENLVSVEIIISLVGGLSPLLVLAFDSLFKASGGSLLASTSINIFNHGLIILVGFLSGLELPLLIKISEMISPNSQGKTLAIDYLGTLVGAILFPIVILPRLDLFSIGYSVAFLNALVALAIVYKFKIKSQKLLFISTAILALFTIALFKNESINNWVMENWYF